MKKLLAITLSVLAAAMMLTACGDSEDGEVTESTKEEGTSISTSDTEKKDDDDFGDKMKDDMDKAETDISEKLS